MQARNMPGADTLMKNCYGMAPLYDDLDPHWSIAKQFVNNEVDPDSNHQIAVVVYADRDGQL